MFLCAPPAFATELDGDFPSLAEYWSAEWPPNAWQEDLANPPLVSAYEVNWDEATRVDIDDLQDKGFDLNNPFGANFYCGAGYPAPTQWLIGKGDELGILSLQLGSSGTGQCGSLAKTMDLGIAIHFISGPVQTDLPPRVYDFTLGIPFRGLVGDSWRYDLLFRMGWYSDFKGSAREGIRFPSHLVLYNRATDWWEWVLGVDVLDRDDILLLPVFGALWTPSEKWRFEAVFPRPLIGRRFAEGRWVYFTAQMGGGTWDIKRDGGAEDVFTYRDLQVLLGVQGPSLGGLLGLSSKNFLEIGYVFERHLEYRSGSPVYKPPDMVLLRTVARY
ncbi:MAG: hypothetical protein EA424_06245 [Planctomycetaceae bacterium]|nr:MAG: hypothetical protein EA424_06245 [Planctomycetaceae bacterium]